MSVGRTDEAALRARQGIALDPTFGISYDSLVDSLGARGSTEAQLQALRKILVLVRTPTQSQLSQNGFSHKRDFANSQIDDILRDDQALLNVLQHEGTLPEYSSNSKNARIYSLAVLSQLGEYKRVSAALPLLPFNDPAFSTQANAVAAEFAIDTGRRAKAVTLMERTIAAATAQLPNGKTLADLAPPGIAQYAGILVASGRTADAAKAIAPTRLDCYPCLVARGEVAAAQRDLPAATRWFAEAARQGPSLPQADYQWGRMLAANDNRPAALAHFAVAAKRAPGWYEPPYAAGRVLIAAHRFGEARAQLEKAHAAAPKRADVALALGRAQWLGGDRKAALATWAAARRLDLLRPDLAWLKRIDAAIKRVG